MSQLLELEEDKLFDQLVPLLEGFDSYIAKAEPLFEIGGVRLELIARTLPHNQAVYSVKAQEAKQLVKALENFKAKIEARMIRNMNARSSQAFGARETTALIAGEKDVVEINQLIIEASLAYQKLDSIVEAFKQMGWMVGNITKLRVAELQDVVL